MSELKAIVLHTEKEQYAHYYIKGIDTEIILIHEFEEKELKTLMLDLKSKEHECPFLVIVDKDKTIKFDDLSSIEKIVHNSQQKDTTPVHTLIQRIQESIELNPPLKEIYIKENFTPQNPHRNSKSSNCKIRRR